MTGAIYTCLNVNSDHYLEKVTSCDRVDCTCGFRRCGVCKSAFVFKTGEICVSCKDKKLLPCVVCNRITSDLMTKLTLKPPFLIYKRDVCKSCEEYVLINQHYICEVCHSRDYAALDEVVVCKEDQHRLPTFCPECKKRVDVLARGVSCPTCYYGQGFEEEKQDVCHSCNKTTWVDYSGHCKACTILTNINLDGGDCTYCSNCSNFVPKGQKYCFKCIRQVRTCATCQEEFARKFVYQYECGKCQPRCYCCNSIFNANLRTDKFCSTCAIDIERGICGLCRRVSVSLDQRGHCPTCSSQTFKAIEYPCSRCRKNSVHNIRDICKSCASTTHTCPSCKTADIKADNFVCKTCQEKIYS